jgi:HTH-type transcriptional regulator/antitoxin HigA
MTKIVMARMVGLMNSLLDTAGDDEDHPLSGLLDLVGDMVSKYEQEHHPNGHYK